MTYMTTPAGLESPPRSDPQLRVRTLQIEADGDRWKGPIKPKIRLMGLWLAQAGFKPRHRVRVTCVAPGVIELRSPEALDSTEPRLPPMPSSDHPF